MFEVNQIKKLGNLELEVYHYVMDNQHKVRYMKIRELAEEAHVSTTTILNFCKKLDCDGYLEFKIKFREYVEKTKGSRISDDVTETMDFLKKSSSAEFENQLELVADVAVNAPRIIFIGSGMSGIMAKYGARYFSSMGKFSLYVDEPHYPTEGHFFENALVIVFSVSGESNDVINHVSRFKKENCQIVSITNTENCTLARMSDFNIAYYVSYAKIKQYDITTQLPAMSIIERIGRKLYNQGFLEKKK